jgi:hypothetical protein
MPAVLRIVAWHHRRFTGESFDLQRVTWHPPLTPAAAMRLESAQIESMGLFPLVSLTDHDDIESCCTPGPSALPVSTEWTVPVGPTFFHLGIHNLPRSAAREMAEAMFRAAKSGARERIRQMLAEISAARDTLVVLNHPLWDEAEVGSSAHLHALESLLWNSGEHIHAVEVNGLRSWGENKSAVELAAEWNKPVISGGDRHGAEPSAILNLTNARTFDEFVVEVRDGASQVAFLPQYREPLRLRWLVTAKDIFRPYTEAESDAPTWRDRFFYEQGDGISVPLRLLWPATDPMTVRPLFAALDLVASDRLRPTLRRVLTNPAEPAFV